MQAPDTAIIETLEHMLGAECGTDVLTGAEQTWPAQLWRVIDESALPRTWPTGRHRS